MYLVAFPSFDHGSAFNWRLVSCSHGPVSFLSIPGTTRYFRHALFIFLASSLESAREPWLLLLKNHVPVGLTEVSLFLGSCREKRKELCACVFLYTFHTQSSLSFSLSLNILKTMSSYWDLWFRTFTSQFIRLCLIPFSSSEKLVIDYPGYIHLFASFWNTHSYWIANPHPSEKQI